MEKIIPSFLNSAQTQAENIEYIEKELSVKNEFLLNDVIDLCMIKSIRYLEKNYINSEFQIWTSGSDYSGFLDCRVIGAQDDSSKDLIKKCWFWFGTGQHINHLFKGGDVNYRFTNTPGDEAANMSILHGSKAKEWLARYEISLNKAQLEDTISSTKIKLDKKNNLKL